MGDTLVVTSESSFPRDPDTIVEEHMHLVHHVVRDVSRRLPTHVDTDDLISAGYIGLVQAAKSYDKSTGVPFARWASRRIKGAVIDELRAMDWASRQLRTKQKTISATEAELATQLGRHPEHAEVADRIGISVEELNAQRIQLNRRIVSLDTPEGDACNLVHDGVTPDEYVVQEEQWRRVEQWISELAERERRVIHGVYFEQLSNAELSEQLNVSASRVSQIKSSAIKKLSVKLNNKQDSTPGPVEKGKKVQMRYV